MDSQVVTHGSLALPQQGIRARLLTLLGPLTSFAGVGWAIVQPYRITLLHPREQSFWWLAVEPPLLVVAVGLFFTYVIARPLLADMERGRGTRG